MDTRKYKLIKKELTQAINMIMIGFPTLDIVETIAGKGFEETLNFYNFA